ncbi:SDR family oxidoreductase, partial [Myxococcota bacterium]|nr:SDR family oxidoreductase [Myxococcota bacterium]
VHADAPARIIDLDPRLGRWVVEAARAPALGLPQPELFTGAKIAVTDDASGVAHELVRILRERGLDAELDRDDLDADVVVFVAGFGDVPSIDAALTIERSAITRARRYAERPRERGAFVLAFDAGGDLGLSGRPGPRTWLLGLPGLAKTAALEWPGLRVRAIDLARAERSAAEVAAALAGELLFGGSEVEIGLDHDGRRTKPVVRREAVERSSSNDLGVDASTVWVVSGGARGVTAGCVVELARRYRGRFVLLGRTPLEAEPAATQGAKSERELMAALAASAPGTPPAELRRRASAILANREIVATLERISAVGSEAAYVPCDVRSVADTTRALDEVREEWGPIGAVVHAAGVIEDKLIAQKSDAQVDRVLGTKLDGLRALLAATDHDPLRALVMFGSISGRTGNVGQADYAMANEVLAKVARAEATRRPGCVVKALAWGPWKGGMVTPGLEKVFESRGVPLIPLEVGARMLADELAHGRGVELVLGASPELEPASVDVLVNKRTHGYLEGHRIRGVPVLPAVLALEWFARAAHAEAPGLELVEVRNLRVLRGVTLERFDDGGHQLSVRHTRRTNEGDTVTLGLELRGPRGELHYSADAVMSAVRRPRSLAPEAPSVDAWGARDVYGGVLFHGPEFQVIRTLEGVSHEGGRATVAGVHAHGWPSEAWRTDSAALDGALQLALLWSEHVLGRASLPTSIERARVFTEAPRPGELTCLLRARARHADRAVADLYLVDGEGHLVAELAGVETHALPG